MKKLIYLWLVILSLSRISYGSSSPKSVVIQNLSPTALGYFDSFFSTKVSKFLSCETKFAGVIDLRNCIFHDAPSDPLEFLRKILHASIDQKFTNKIVYRLRTIVLHRSAFEVLSRTEDYLNCFQINEISSNAIALVINSQKVAAQCQEIKHFIDEMTNQPLF